jgi:anti-sigma-K factor RskA
MSDDHDPDAERAARLDDLLALAALGELTPAEEHDLDVALADDAALRSELDADLEVAARLQSVDPSDPPPELKQRVMDGLEERPRPGDAETGRVADLDGERKRRRRLWIPAAAAAVALVAVAGVITMRDEGRDEPPEEIAAVIDAPDAQERVFAGDLDGTLRAVVSAEADALVLEGVDVGALSDAETYQLWLVDADGAASSLGLFRPGADGRVLVAFEGADPTGSTLGVTVEPEGGSEQPTPPIVATA